MDRDRQHLSLLSIFHYVASGFSALFALVFLVYVAFGAVLLKRPDIFTDHGRTPPPPLFVGWLLVGLGAGVFLTGLAYGAAMIVAGRALAGRRRWVFCVVMAVLSLPFSPWGTVLGVFTLTVLLRPSVKTLFGRPP